MKRHVIGINGLINSGKDELYKAMPAGTIRMAFGDPLKEEVAHFVATHTAGTAASFLLDKNVSLRHFEDIMSETWNVRFVGNDYARLVAAFDSPPIPSLRNSVPEEHLQEFDEVVKNRDRVTIMSVVLRALDNTTKNWLHHQVKALACMHDRDLKGQFRTLMQWWGTEYRCKQCADMYWIDRAREAVLGTAVDAVIVFTDMRFPNEASFVADEMHGSTVRITRPGVEVGPSPHESEIALDNWLFDYHADNSGSLDDLSTMAGLIYETATGAEVYA